MIAFNRLLSKARNIGCCRRLYSQKPAAAKKKVDEKDDPSLVRNIGILAHIDAGKTTTTERMLFYSGTIDNMGEVHHGNTVTDFMEQERQRGITITSASVTFSWDKHTINLLDTPGHIDFTMEVEQTLNVMDGAVVVLDGTAGVEAQTLTVWRQAERYRIPKLIYINKMDRQDAGFYQSIHTVETKLKTPPIVLQVPFFTPSKVFKGVIDLVNMECYDWNEASLGTSYKHRKITEEDGKVWESAFKARMRLTETLIHLDDNIAELVLSDKESIEQMPSVHITNAVRRVTGALKGVPIFCGSSYKNIGIQLLLDAVVRYLPSPISSKSSLILECFKNNLCARVFKIRHDKFRGPVIFLRIYSGSISKGQLIFNVRLWQTETCQKVMVAYADDYEELNVIGTGNIAAVTGLRNTRVGDLITSTATVVTEAKNVLESKKNVNNNNSDNNDNNNNNNGNLNEIFVPGALIPDPVFFCSVEAPSQKYVTKLDKALNELSLEDPSLRLSFDKDTGQTILAGMGELHLEIIKDRIRKEYGVDVDTGPLQIAYKEELVKPMRDTHASDHTVGNSTHSVRIDMSVMHKTDKSKEVLLLDRSPDCVTDMSAIFPKHLMAVRHGVKSALTNGPKLFCPVVNVQVMLHCLDVGRGTAESMISSAVSQCVNKLLKAGGTRLLEPIMHVEVVCPEDLVPGVLVDVSRRRALVQKSDMRGTDRVLEALIPLSELLGFATDLRILTSGQASFTMEFHNYAAMTPEKEAEVVRKAIGAEIA